MMNDEAAADDVVFDVKSGISEEDQREILADINGIAEKNRQSLASAAPAGRIKAKKNGGIFPLAVNGIALLLLAGGFFLLSTLHTTDDVRLRAGTKVFNSAERALIEEIRKETLLQIEEKENEINRIIAKMTEVDALLEEMYSSNRELSADQRAAEDSLKLLYEEYRQGLSALQDDRSRILENARTRETALYAQLEARTREFSAVSEQQEAAMTAAYGELERLNAEHDKAAVIEAQLTAYVTSAGALIRNGELIQAADTITAMRQFLNTPAFQGIRSVQARKDFYTRTITVLETLLEDARTNQAASGGGNYVQPDTASTMVIEELVAEKARLEETIAELNRSAAAAGSRNSDAARRLGELDNANAVLRNTNASLESAAAALRNTNASLEAAAREREEVIAGLRSQNAALTRTVAARDSQISELEAKISGLDSEISTLRQRFQAILELSQ
jgi:chromosome segregation ATPase